MCISARWATAASRSAETREASWVYRAGIARIVIHQYRAKVENDSQPRIAWDGTCFQVADTIRDMVYTYDWDGNPRFGQCFTTFNTYNRDGKHVFGPAFAASYRVCRTLMFCAECAGEWVLNVRRRTSPCECDRS